MTFAAIGSLIPDIDHPQSALGRVLFFISHPLNRMFGHRTITHSLVVWLPFLLGGFITDNLFWIGIGAISHIVIDALNTSGVQMFYPYSRKIFVIGGQNWRFPTASKQEFVILLALGVLVGVEGRISSLGGLQGFFQMVTGSYNLVWKDYQKAGLTEYYISGKWRMKGGEICTKTYEVIGETKERGLAIFSNKIYVIPEDIQPLYVRGRKGKQEWKVVRIRGLMVCENSGFVWNGKRWIQVSKNDVIWGIYKTKGEVELKPYAPLNYENAS